MSLFKRQAPIPLRPPADFALEQAFARFQAARDTSAIELRDAVRAYVDDAKTRQQTPEQVIIDLKKIADRAGLARALVPHSSSISMARLRDPYTCAVTWCIERYFESGRFKSNSD